MRRSPGVGVAISLVALAGVAWWIAGQEAPRLPSSPSSIAVALAAAGLYGAVVLGRGLRWHRVLAHARIRHRRVDAVALTVVGLMGNAVLPARGGEVLRVLLLAVHSSARRREVVGSLVADRLFDAAALLVLLVGVTVSGVARDVYGAAPAVVGVGAAVAAAGALALYLRLRRAGRLDRFAARVRPVARMGRVLLTREGARLALATLGIWLMEAGVVWLCTAALDLGLSFADAALVLVVASLSVVIPAGPGYAGTFDAAVLFALDAVGVTGGAAVGMLLLYRAVVFLPVTVAGLVVLLNRYGGLRSLRRPAAGDDPAERPTEPA